MPNMGVKGGVGKGIVQMLANFGPRQQEAATSLGAICAAFDAFAAGYGANSQSRDPVIRIYQRN